MPEPPWTIDPLPFIPPIEEREPWLPPPDEPFDSGPFRRVERLASVFLLLTVVGTVLMVLAAMSGSR